MTRSSVTLHVITAAEASLLDDVAPDVFDHEVQPAWLDGFLAGPANVLVVARLDGQVVGMATGLCYVHPDKPLAMFINEVGVAPPVQGQGIGKRLVAALLDEARTRGCTEAWVATEVGNAPARALYESLGGVPDEEPAVVYVYPLAGSARPPTGDA